MNRDYEGKQEVIVYDYVDSHISVFNNMYLKRLRTYKKIGFRVASYGIAGKQVVNAIYDAGNYTEVFEQDLIETGHSVIISSPGITQEKIKRFIYLMKPKQEAGIKITVITEHPESASYGNSSFLYSLIEQMNGVGINVKMVVGETGHFAVIDDHLVWHGGINGQPILVTAIRMACFFTAQETDREHAYEGLPADQKRNREAEDHNMVFQVLSNFHLSL